MALEWRPANDPPNIPLTVYAHEDFKRRVEFDGALSTWPPGAAIALAIYPDSNVESAVIAVWPAEVDLAEHTGEWSVDYAEVDAVALPGFYRLILTLPNPSDTENPTVERCLALGKITRK